MDRIDQLRIFIRVAQSGSFTQAADQLGLPRPTASLAVQQLEERLGIRVLNRTTRRVSLTQDGESLLDRALALVADVEEFEQQFQPNTGQVKGRLRVDVPSRIARRLLAPALPEFFAAHPGIEIDLGSSDRMVNLVHEGIDLALRVGTSPSSSLVAQPIGHFRLANCASRAYLERHGTPLSPADLVRHQAIRYVSSVSGRVAPWEWLEGGELQTLRMDGPVSVDNAETYIACCLAGLGLIQIPAFDVVDHLASGELVEVLHPWSAPAMPVQLVYPHRRQQSRRMQAFSSWLIPLLGAHCSVS